MWRSILAVVVGTFTAVILIVLFDIANHALYSPPAAVAEAMARGDKNAMAAAVKDWLPHAPLGALILVPAGWIVATFIGSLAAGLIAKHRLLTHALLAAALPLAGAAANLWMIPHPVWIAFVGLSGMPLAAVLGGLVASHCKPAGPRPYDMRVKNMAC